MLLSAVSVLVVAQSSSEIREGFMNNPVLTYNISTEKYENYFFKIYIFWHTCMWMYSLIVQWQYGQF